MADMTEERKAAGAALARALKASRFKDVTETELTGAYTVDFKPMARSPRLLDQLPSSAHVSADGSFGGVVVRMPLRDDRDVEEMRRAAERAAAAAGPDWYAGMQHSGPESTGRPHVVLPAKAPDRSPRSLVSEMSAAVRAYAGEASGRDDFSFS